MVCNSLILTTTKALIMFKTFLSIGVVSSSLLIMTSTSALTPVAPTPQKKSVAKKVTKLTQTKTTKVLNTKINKKTNANKMSVDKGNAGGFGITGKVSTLGLGADLTYGLMDKLNARFSINGGSLNADGENDGINYDGTLKLQSFGGILDFHPTGGGFRLSAGIYNNGNEIDLDATGANQDAEIGDITYDISDAKLNTKVSFKSTAPYLGIGWGNAVDKASKFSMTTDLGVLFQGAPVAKLTASGNVIPKSGIHTGPAIDLAGSSDAALEFQRELQKEEDNLNGGDNLKKFKLFPVVSLGFNYRF